MTKLPKIWRRKDNTAHICDLKFRATGPHIEVGIEHMMNKPMRLYTTISTKADALRLAAWLTEQAEKMK